MLGTRQTQFKLSWSLHSRRIDDLEEDYDPSQYLRSYSVPSTPKKQIKAGKLNILSSGRLIRKLRGIALRTWLPVRER